MATPNSSVNASGGSRVFCLPCRWPPPVVSSAGTLLDQDGQRATYQIVEGVELNSGEPDQLSSDSPVGLALLGKKAGDEVEVTVPDGKRRYTIIVVK